MTAKGDADGSQPRARRNPARLDRTLDAAILDATLAGVADQGYDRMSMDDVAARARVGKAAIYRRWSSKAEVVSAAIAHWRRRRGPVEPPDTGSLRGDIEILISSVPDYNESDLDTIKVIVGVATAAARDPALAAALDDLVLATPRQVMRSVLDRAVARGEVPAGRDLSLIADTALGLNVLRVIGGRPIDRVWVRRILEDVVLPLATAPPSEPS
jgi:AcrR family transcriptional regulator